MRQRPQISTTPLSPRKDDPAHSGPAPKEIQLWLEQCRRRHPDGLRSLYTAFAGGVLGRLTRVIDHAGVVAADKQRLAETGLSDVFKYLWEERMNIDWRTAADANVWFDYTVARIALVPGETGAGSRPALDGLGTPAPMTYPTEPVETAGAQSERDTRETEDKAP